MKSRARSWCRGLLGAWKTHTSSVWGKETGNRALSCSAWNTGLLQSSAITDGHTLKERQTPRLPPGLWSASPWPHHRTPTRCVLTRGSSVHWSPHTWDQPRPIGDAERLYHPGHPQEADLSPAGSAPGTRCLAALWQKQLTAPKWTSWGQERPGLTEVGSSAAGPQSCDSLPSQGQASF